MAVSVHRRVTSAVAILVTAVALLFVAVPPSPAHADPDEGGNATLNQKLQEAAIAYYEIQAKLTASQKRQSQLQKQLKDSELALVQLNAEIALIAADRYKSGQMGMLNAFLLAKGDTGDLLQGAAVAEYLAWRDDDDLRRHRIIVAEATEQRRLLDAEVANEKKQLKELDRQKRNAEKALAAVGGMPSAGYSGPRPKTAQPAVRNADGTFPRESCSLPDPTGSGGACITPRMSHALIEAQLAGFTRFVKCWRTQAWGEHPLGRACDFAVSPTAFAGTATGGDKRYGDQLAAWSIRNASALGVLYVIWYRQVWMPGLGWRSYSGGGDPSSDHTNHVHLSMI